MRELVQDLRYAVRMLAKSPVFTAIAVVTLALGIGGNTAIFSVVNAVLLKPLPYSNPNQLSILSEKSPEFPEMSVAYPNFEEWRDQNHSFEAMAAFRTESFSLASGGAAEHVRARQVSASFLPLLGVHPLLGRNFLPEEDRAGGSLVTILGYGLWQTKFGGDREIVGKSVVISDRNYTIDVRDEPDAVANAICRAVAEGMVGRDDVLDQGCRLAVASDWNITRRRTWPVVPLCPER